MRGDLSIPMEQEIHTRHICVFLQMIVSISIRIISETRVQGTKENAFIQTEHILQEMIVMGMSYTEWILRTGMENIAVLM